MLCEKCGKPLEDGSTICIDCAAAEEIVQEVPAQETVEETIELNVQPEPPVKKKKKGGLIALIAAGAVLVAGAVAVMLNLDAVSNFIHKTFDSPQEYMVYVEEKAADAAVEELSAAYDAYLKGLTTDTAAVSGQLHVLLGEDVLGFLEPALEQAGLPAGDLTWLSDVLLDVELTVKEKKAAAALGLGLGQKKLLTLDAVLDIEAGDMWIALPELSSQYLKGELDLEGVEELEANAELVEALPSADTLESLIHTYYGIVLAGIDTVEKDTRDVTVDGVSQKFTRLTATVTEEDIANIVIDVLEYAKTDAALKAVIDDFSEYYNATEKEYWDENLKPYYGTEYEAVDMHAELLEAIEEGLEQMQDVLEECEEVNYLTIATCIDAEGNIAGREVKIYGEDMEDMGDTYYITVRNGGKIAYELVAEDLKITGSGTESGGKLSMTYTLTHEDTKYLTVKVSDFVAKDDAMAYTMVFEPERALLTDGLGLDSSVTSIISMMDFSLEIGCDMKGGNGYMGIKVFNGDKLLAGITVDSQEEKPEDIAIPEGAVDSKEWVQGMKFDTVLDSLGAAGVPDAVVEMVEDLVGALK